MSSGQAAQPFISRRARRQYRRSDPGAGDVNRVVRFVPQAKPSHRSTNAKRPAADIATPSASQPAATPSRPGLPILVITGFLGAGKSTLLNRLLTNARGARVAVFVNELGALDIDGRLVAMRECVDDADLVLLNNGCVCCTINENLIASVNRVLARGDVGSLIIETTGAADLLPLLDTFRVTEELEQEVHVDAVVTVVDVLSFRHTDFVESVAARNQMLHADILLLNKVDLVTGEDAAAVQTTIDDVEKRIRALCAEADGERSPPIIRCSHANVPLELLVDTSRFLPSSGGIVAPFAGS
jgi:G3E family GTPase